MSVKSSFRVEIYDKVTHKWAVKGVYSSHKMAIKMSKRIKKHVRVVNNRLNNTIWESGTSPKI